MSEQQNNLPPEEDQIVDRAGRALRESHVPEGPPPAILESVMAAGGSSAKGTENRFQKRKFKMSRILRIAAVLIVVALGGTIVLLTQGGGITRIAFADVVQPFLAARTATYDITTKVKDGADQKAKVMFMEPGRMRYTRMKGIVLIADFQQGRSVALNSKDKTALVFEMQNMGGDHDLQSQEMLFFNTREYIRKGLKNEQKTVKYLEPIPKPHVKSCNEPK